MSGKPKAVVAALALVFAAGSRCLSLAAVSAGGSSAQIESSQEALLDNARRHGIAFTPCTENPALDCGTPLVHLRADEAIGALNPRFFGRFFVAQSVAFCASWPAAEPPEIRNVARQMATPILIVANDFDSNTPIVDARGLAHALGMEDSLLRYEGGGHTAFFKGIACIDAAIETYLIDRRLPPAGSSCPAQSVSFGAASRSLSGQVQVETGLFSEPPARIPFIPPLSQ